uniref:Uncharacterized protein n=1 Tax=Oryza brachyantha TaxID=4533 RepID=J3NBK6_ORYBR
PSSPLLAKPIGFGFSSSLPTHKHRHTLSSTTTLLPLLSWGPKLSLAAAAELGFLFCCFLLAFPFPLFLLRGSRGRHHSLHGGKTGTLLSVCMLLLLACYLLSALRCPPMNLNPRAPPHGCIANK